MDLSKNGMAICILESTSRYNVWYVSGQESFSTPNIHALRLEDPTDPGTELANFINEKTKDKARIFVTYEASLVGSDVTYQDQRVFSDSIIHEVRSRLPSHTIFAQIDNLLVKTAWRRSFGPEQCLLGYHADFYSSVLEYIRKHQGAHADSKNRQRAKRAYKLANFIVWDARRMYTFDVTLDSSGPALFRMIKDTSVHPISDIIDAYMLARHTYFTDLYTKRTDVVHEHEEPPDVVLFEDEEKEEPPPRPDEEKGFSADRVMDRRYLHKNGDGYYQAAELTDATWIKYYKDTDNRRVLIDQFDTGAFIGKGRSFTDEQDRIPTMFDDTHAPDTVFTFIKRTHEIGLGLTALVEFNRKRREMNIWKRERAVIAAKARVAAKS
jgi:hypothetical protein